MRGSASLEERLREADRYFMGRGSVREAALRIARLLAGEGIDYAIAGALACAAHGHERLTTDVDILLTPESLRRFKASWLGRGYAEVAQGLKAVRDTQEDVKLDFLLTGDYPGDGLPKPVAFPAPASVAEEHGALRVVSLPALLELKIASGMSAPHRMRDLDDAMRLIKANGLDRSYADRLNPWVREKFAELWALAQVVEDY
ncbi:MAG: hypothetical protein HYY06_18690 [Deltaproteobacteria bacterium]|nr:hypothetical protein [Deltaproteobacteria bacterium]